MLNRDGFVQAIAGRLVVSCQAPGGHALRDAATLTRLAQAAEAGGAAAIRCGGVGGVSDVTAIAAAVNVPVIGLTKDGSEGVYITPTVGAALAVVAAGADVVATDATARPRPDGASFADTVRAVHDRGRLVMADVSTAAEGAAAARGGADLVATTLSGHTHGGSADGPDLELVADLCGALPGVPVVAEGRYHTPEAAAAAITAGATCVVVGTAITDATWITASFAAAITHAPARPPPR